MNTMSLQECFRQILPELAATVAAVNERDALALNEQISAAERIFVAGVGRSGLVMRGFAMRLMHMDFTVYVVGDVTTPSIQRGDLLLLGSGSGATPSLRAYAASAQAVDAQIALITTQAASPLAQAADLALVIPAPTPKADATPGRESVQPMASLFEQSMLLTLDALSMLLMQQRELDDGVTFLRHANLE